MPDPFTPTSPTRSPSSMVRVSSSRMVRLPKARPIEDACSSVTGSWYHGRPMQQTENLNVASLDLMPSPDEVKATPSRSPSGPRPPWSPARRAIEAILDGRDRRLFVVVGPCSIHDPVAGLDYARRLRGARRRGLRHPAPGHARLLREAAHLAGLEGLHQRPAHGRLLPHRRGHGAGAPVPARRERARACPAGTEALDPIAPQYYGDLIAWTAIGARTSESQTHREMSSGLSTPVGFKNGTDGDIDGGGQRHPLGRRPAQLPGHQRPGALGHRPHPRQPLRPPGAARRRRAAQLRHRLHHAGRAGARQGQAAAGTSSSTARTPTPGRSRSCSRW